jgi:5-methylcytosine-specific restriction endonuclease McrA
VSKAEYNRAYYAANRERLAALNCARWQANRERYAVAAKAWRVVNAAAEREKKRAWRKANPDAALAKDRTDYARRGDAIRAYQSLWRKLNPEKMRTYRNRHRAALGSFTAAELRARYEEQCGLCAYCLAKLNGKFHADHVIAVARGGSSDIGNIVCACASCNLAKGAKSVVEFIGRRAA